MRLVDAVPFADSLEELEPSERAQLPRILRDVVKDYLAKAPQEFLATSEGQEKVAAWARARSELQAIDAINTQRYLAKKGIRALTVFQKEGRMAKDLLTSKLPPPPWENAKPAS
ncbi:MAG: hypothetical protein HY685_02135 [Chloroflexi bacterium]|nr:hypothetical protein [Chloroflexota bacterium]